MDKLHALMETLPEDLDAVLLDSEPDRFYYTGMASSAGTVFATRKKQYFIIDSRYIEVARKTVKNCEVLLQDNLKEQIRKLAEQEGIKRIGLEASYCTLETLSAYREALPGCELAEDSRVQDLINAQRMLKDEEELSCIRKAQELTDKSFAYICGVIRPGMTEREIALDLEFYSRKIGSEAASFEFIVVSGPNTSMPHGVPGGRKVQQGDFITMDFGCVWGGYHSDMTRTVAVGQPTVEMKEVYNTVLEANLRSMAAVRGGVPLTEVDAVARNLIAEAGHKEHFGHGLGHSVGLEIHEEPRFSPTAGDGKCVPGQIMTIEPGIYLEGEFGCRIEDMIYVTENGCINLTGSEKSLIIL